jgi:pantoate--beta-alanine ligase
MQIIAPISALRERLKGERSVAFVPTMGNLHEGHLSLVTLANQYAKCVVVSMFVNRLQFGPNEDFDKYPRTLVDDCEPLAELGVDVVFAPTERELYPTEQQFVVNPGEISRDLEGAYRPGHFQGVATVVMKLFHVVQPQFALLGKKDFQQLQVIRHMVEQMNMPIKVIGGETVRAHDGLALSSRNRYLSPAERLEAVRLNQELGRIKRAIESGSRDFPALEAQAREHLESHGWKVDYVAVRSSATLGAPPSALEQMVILGAAYLGGTRLIDNIEL